METLMEKKRRFYTVAKSALEKESTTSDETDDYKKMLHLQICNVRRNSSAVADALAGNDTLLIKIAGKFKWFFRNMDVENIMNMVARASHHSRFRILESINKHCKNEAHCDVLYEYALDNCGVEFASRLLPACSIQRISKAFQNDQIGYVRQSQLELIHRKCPTAVYKYLEDFAEMNRDAILRAKEKSLKRFEIELHYTHMTHIAKFLKSIVKSDVSFVLRYYAKYKTLFPTDNGYNTCYCLRFGRRQTKIALERDKEYVLRNSSVFVKVLRNGTLRRKLTMEDFREYFTNLLPGKSSDIVWADLYDVTKHLKSGGRFEMLNDCYSEKYGLSVLDDDGFADSDWPHCVNASQRHTWALRRISLETPGPYADIHYWYKYANPEIAIENITKYIDIDLNEDEQEHCIQLAIDLFKANETNEDVFDFVISLILRMKFEEHASLGMDYLRERIAYYDFEHERWSKFETIFRTLGVYDSPISTWPTYDTFNDYIYRNVKFGEQIPESVLKNIIPVFDSFSITFINFDLPVNQEIFLQMSFKLFDILMRKLEEMKRSNEPLAIVFRCILSFLNHCKFNRLLRYHSAEALERFAPYIKSHADDIVHSSIEHYICCYHIKILLVDHILNLWNEQENYMIVLNNKPIIFNASNLAESVNAIRTKRPRMKRFYNSLRFFYDDYRTVLIDELQKIVLKSEDETMLKECSYALSCLLNNDAFVEWFDRIYPDVPLNTTRIVVRYLHHVRPALSTTFLARIWERHGSDIPRGTLLSLRHRLPINDWATFSKETKIVIT